MRGDAASRRIFVDGDLIKRDDFLNRLGYLSSFVLGPRVVVRILTREREVVRALLFSTFLLRRRALGVGDDRDERLEPFPNVHVEQFRNFLLGVVRRVSRVVIKLLPVMSHAAFRQRFPSALKVILFAVFARRSFSSSSSFFFFFVLLSLLLFASMNSRSSSLVTKFSIKNTPGISYFSRSSRLLKDASVCLLLLLLCC